MQFNKELNVPDLGFVLYYPEDWYIERYRSASGSKYGGLPIIDFRSYEKGIFIDLWWGPASEWQSMQANRVPTGYVLSEKKTLPSPHGDIDVLITRHKISSIITSFILFLVVGFVFVTMLGLLVRPADLPISKFIGICILISIVISFFFQRSEIYHGPSVKCTFTYNNILYMLSSGSGQHIGLMMDLLNTIRFR